MSEMGDGDSDGEFFSKAPSPKMKKERQLPAYFPTRDKVTYDYKFDLSSDEEENEKKGLKYSKVESGQSNLPASKEELLEPAPFLKAVIFPQARSEAPHLPAQTRNPMVRPQQSAPRLMGPQNMVPHAGMVGPPGMNGLNQMSTGIGLPNQMGMPGNMSNQPVIPANMSNQIGMPGNMQNQMGVPGCIPNQMVMSGNMSQTGMGTPGNLPYPMGMQSCVPNQMGMAGNMPSQIGIPGSLPNQPTMSGNMHNQMAMPGNIPNQLGMPGNIPNQMAMPVNIPNQMGMPGNMPNQMAMPNNMPNQIGMPGNMPCQMNAGNTQPQMGGMQGNINIPNQVSMPGNMPNQMGMPGNIPNQMGMPGNMTNQIVMPGNMTNQMGMPGNIPNQMGMTGNMPNQMGMPGNISNQMGMQGNVNVPNQMGMAGNMPNQMGMPGNISNQMGMQGNVNVPNQMGMPGNMPNQVGMPGNIPNQMGMQGNINMPNQMWMPQNMGHHMGIPGNMANPMAMRMPNAINVPMMGNPGNFQGTGPSGPCPARGSPGFPRPGHSNSNKRPFHQRWDDGPVKSVPTNAVISKPPMLKNETSTPSLNSPPTASSPELKQASSESSTRIENKVTDKYDTESPGSSHNVKMEPTSSEMSAGFKNDGSFLEVFKKIKKEPEGPTHSEGKKKTETDKRITPKFLPNMVGKRRGGRVLKTGLVEKVKKPEPEETGGPKDAWSLYMAEVKKYREANCEEEGKTRALVK